MQLGEIIKDVNISFASDDLKMDTNVCGIGYNSALLRRGELFVAIKGYNNDGHDYIKDAVEKGAVCVVCEKPPEISIPYIITNDTRKALAIASAAWFGYPAEKMKIIGVTGTNGKTSVTHLIKHIIEKCSDYKVGLIGTIENLIGDRELSASLTTPDSYELQSMLNKMAMENCRYVVMEVSSHALVLSRVYGINYEIGVYTNLTPEHLDFHSSMDEYADAKAMLFENCKQSVINIDDKYSKQMIDSSSGKIITYAIDNDIADFAGNDIKLYPEKVEFSLTTDDKKNQVKLHMPGLFSVYNALAATATVNILGFDTNSIVKSLICCKGVKGRAQVLPTGCDFTVIVDYAHTPDALENIIKAANATNRVITLFGCGGDRDKSKRPLMGKVATELSDYVFITSDNPRTEDPKSIINDILTGVEKKDGEINEENYTVITDRAAAICKALDVLSTGDVLIIAGKGHETYQIIGNEKIHYDDREIVEKHLSLIKNKKRIKHHSVQ